MNRALYKLASGSIFASSWSSAASASSYGAEHAMYGQRSGDTMDHTVWTRSVNWTHVAAADFSILLAVVRTFVRRRLPSWASWACKQKTMDVHASVQTTKTQLEEREQNNKRAATVFHMHAHAWNVMGGRGRRQQGSEIHGIILPAPNAGLLWPFVHMTTDGDPLRSVSMHPVCLCRWHALAHIFCGVVVSTTFADDEPLRSF